MTSYKNANFGVQQGFLTGTSVSLGMGNTLGYKQNSPNNDFNPVDQGALSFSITQNLLNGFGVKVNNRAIRIAKNQLHISDLTFKQQTIATVNNVVTLYWDLVSFNDSLKVKQKALELNTQLNNENKRRAEMGALAEIDIIQAEDEVKNRQQDIVTAETQVLQQEMILKSVLTRGGFQQPAVARPHRSHRPFQCAGPGCDSADPGYGKRGLQKRPEIEQSQIGLEDARINMLGTKNNLAALAQRICQPLEQRSWRAASTLACPRRYLAPHSQQLPATGIIQAPVRTPGSVNSFS